MNKHKDVVIVLCKCQQFHKTFGIRTERLKNDHWKFTWAFPVSAIAAKREGYDRITIKGSLEYDLEYPGCPYCGTMGLVICNCSRLNCHIMNAETFICEWCRCSGTICEYSGEAINAGVDL